MMPPGHVAVTWGIASTLQKNNQRWAHLDYRLLAASALLADFIDKPLAILFFTDVHTSQLIAHSLLPNAIIFVLALLFWRKALPYVLAFNAHLLLDRMWNHTESFWWPLFGWNVFWEFKPMNTPGEMVNVYLDIVTRYPQVWVVEVLAVAYLSWFVYRQRLYRWLELWRFLRAGRINIFADSKSEVSHRRLDVKVEVRPKSTQSQESG